MRKLFPVVPSVTNVVPPFVPPRVYTCQCILLVCIESQVQLSSIGTPLVLELHHAESATRVVAASNPVTDQYL